MIVIAGELTLGVLQGIALGVALSLLMLIYRTSHPQGAVLGQLPGTEAYRDVARHPEAITFPGLLIWRIGGDLFFASVGHVRAALKESLSARPDVKRVLLDFAPVNHIDVSAGDALLSFIKELQDRGISVAFARVRDAVRHDMLLAGIEAVVGPPDFYGTNNRWGARLAAIGWPTCKLHSVQETAITPSVRGSSGRKEGDVMRKKEVLHWIEKYVHPFRITKGKGFQLKDYRPGRHVRPQAGERRGCRIAQSRHGVARGKAGHALRAGSVVAAAGLPGDGRGRQGRRDQACHVGHQPSGLPGVLVQAAFAEELDHDFLWRYVKCLPERGRIGIFNRSYYEEVLVVRVHPDLLEQQKLPPNCTGKQIWDERLADIAHFEDYLTRQGTIILKFFLHLSRKEQKKRFLERLDTPEKHWKFSPADIHERAFWEDYARAFEEAIRATAGPHAPWYVVPPTTSGLPGLSSPPLLWRPWITSNSVTRSSTQ